MNDLDKWVKENGFDKPQDDTSKPSHFLFNGGKYYIPRDKEYKFLCYYAEEMKKGTKLYCVEQRSKIFKYFIDIDISDDHYWVYEEIVELGKFIQSIVSQFFEGNHSTICCISSEKIKDDGIHTGIHLIWNDLFVNSESCIIIREGILQKMEEFSKKPKSKWEDTFDGRVYESVGYRMVGSDKMKDKKPENRELFLLYVMDSEGQLRKMHYDRLKRNTKDLVTETSIRYILDTYKDMGMPIKYPIWLKGDFTSLIKSKNMGSSHNYSLVASKDKFVIIKFIRENFPIQYSRCVIKSVFRYPDQNLLITTNSRFCMNIGKNHNSCGIYFFASPMGMYQKCCCRCLKLEGRISGGYCKDYSSKGYPFDEEIIKILFPKYKKKEKVDNSVYIFNNEKNIKTKHKKTLDILFGT